MVVLALVAAIGMTARDIGTKLISRELSTLLLSLYASMLFCVSGGILLLVTGGASLPDGGMILLFVVMTAFLARSAISRDHRRAAWRHVGCQPVQIHSRLLFSLAVGILILGETVNAMMLVGCAPTIGAGLYIWRREIVLQGEPVPAGN